jgi:hypothetical protein
MIIRVAAMAAVFADQMMQAPTVVQCAPTVPEPWWKWLLQFALSVVPVAGGVWIAWMAFHWNSKREHEQWILDQKKLEWRELLDAINECQDSLPLMAQLGDKSSAVSSTVLNDYQKVRKAQQILYDRLFIDRSTIAPVMSAWLSASEKGMTAIGGDALGYALAYGALVDKVRQAARKDLGLKGVDNPETMS